MRFLLDSAATSIMSEQRGILQDIEVKYWVRILFIQWTPLIVAASGPALSGHNNQWILYPLVLF